MAHPVRLVAPHVAPLGRQRSRAALRVSAGAAPSDPSRPAGAGFFGSIFRCATAAASVTLWGCAACFSQPEAPARAAVARGVLLKGTRGRRVGAKRS